MEASTKFAANERLAYVKKLELVIAVYGNAADVDRSTAAAAEAMEKKQVARSKIANEGFRLNRIAYEEHPTTMRWLFARILGFSREEIEAAFAERDREIEALKREIAMLKLEARR